MTTPEQQAREMLQRATSFDLTELANLIAENAALKAELAAIKGAGEPVAWGQLGMLNGKTYLRENWDRSPYPPPPSIIKNLNLVPLYTRPCVPLTDEHVLDFVRDVGLDWQSGWTLDECEPNRYVQLSRAVEAHIKGAKP